MLSMKWKTASMPHQKLRPGTTHCTRAISPHTHILPHCPRTSACPGSADEVIHHVKHVVQKHPKIQALTWTRGSLSPKQVALKYISPGLHMLC